MADKNVNATTLNFARGAAADFLVNYSSDAAAMYTYVNAHGCLDKTVLAAGCGDPAALFCIQLLDYLNYATKYFVIYPSLIGATWNGGNGAPQFNGYGTGNCWDGIGATPWNPIAPLTCNPLTRQCTCPVGQTLGGSGLFTTRTAEEFLIGYKKPDFLVFSKYNGLVNFGGIFGPNTTTPPADNSVPMSGPIPTYKGPYTVYTGADGDNTHITFYKKYLGADHITTVEDLPDAPALHHCVDPGSLEARTNGRQSYDLGCPIWSTQAPYSNVEMIDGCSDGFKAPFMFQEGKDAEDMIVWVSEAQRRVKFSKTTDIDFKNLKLWRYQMNPNVLRNSTDPLCTDIPMAKHYYNVNHPRGVASRQRTDAIDIFLSKPHFFEGDTALFQSQLDIDIAPNADFHDTYLDVEPLTGRTFSGRKRLQLGIFLSKQRFADYVFAGVYANIVAKFPGNTAAQDSTVTTAQGSGANNLYLPILWAAEGKDISDDDAASFVDKIYGTRKVFFVTQIVLVIVGGLMFFTFLILCIKARQGATTSM